MKRIAKTNNSFNFYHLPTSTLLEIKVTHPIFLTFFSNFLTFDSRVFIFSMFCISSNNRSSQRRCSVKKGVLRNFTKSTRKHLCKSLFFNKVAWNFILSKNTFFTEQLRTTASVTNWTVARVAFVYHSKTSI